MNSFETERLILKPTSEGDAAFIHKLFNSPKWIKYIGDRNVRTIDEAKIYIREKIQTQIQRLGYGNYTVIRKSDQEKIGSCGLYDREGIEGIDIGFAFLPEYEKRGYAFEAAKEILKIGIGFFGIKHLKAITTKDNTDSQKLLEKLGMKLSGTFTLPGDDEELLIYELIKETK